MDNRRGTRSAVLRAATALLLVAPAAGCKGDKSSQAAERPPTFDGTVSALPMGGDPQPAMSDVVRRELTAKERDRIADACAEAHEVTSDSACHESMPPAPAAKPTPGVDPCLDAEYCLIIDPVTGTVTVFEGGSQGRPDMRFGVDDEVIEDLTEDSAASPSVIEPPDEDQSVEPTESEPAGTEPTGFDPDEEPGEPEPQPAEEPGPEPTPFPGGNGDGG